MKAMIALLFLIALVGCAPADIALIDLSADDFFVNQYDENELVVAVSVYNYGYTEGKNVGVRCDFYDLGPDEADYEVLVTSGTQNIGNIASTSVSYEEISLVLETPLNDDNYYAPVCWPTSCDDCEILINRIPEIMAELE